MGSVSRTPLYNLLKAKQLPLLNSIPRAPKSLGKQPRFPDILAGANVARTRAGLPTFRQSIICRMTLLRKTTIHEKSAAVP